MFAITTRPPTSLLSIYENNDDDARNSNGAYGAMDIDDLGEGPSTSRRTVVSPGEVITSSKEYMRYVALHQDVSTIIYRTRKRPCGLTGRGHGTYVEDDQVVSNVTGIIDRVNKLISVRGLGSRYSPEVGDLVIGRIVEVGPMRWRVEANARQDAVLMLSSVNLPGGVQVSICVGPLFGQAQTKRRKIEADALKMREFLAEGDVRDRAPTDLQLICSSWSQRYKLSSRMEQCLCTLGRSNTAKWVALTVMH